MERRRADERARLQDGVPRDPSVDALRGFPLRLLPPLLVPHLHAHLPRDLPERLQRALQLADVGARRRVVRVVVPHRGVVEELHVAGLEVGEAELVRARALRVELEAVLARVPRGVHHVPGLVLDGEVEDAVPASQPRALLDQHERAAERVAGGGGVLDDALRVLAADVELQGRGARGGEREEREEEREDRETTRARRGRHSLRRGSTRRDRDASRVARGGGMNAARAARVAGGGGQ